MEDFKIKLFEKDLGKNFPAFNHISDLKATGIKEKLSILLNISIDLPSVNLIKTIDDSQEILDGYKATKKFSIINCLNELRIVPEKKVLINWYRFDNIDEFDCQELDIYFEYIWFETADDIDVFDSTFNWILSIRHYGIIKFLRL